MKEIIPAKALDQHIGILGKTGSGKTFAAKGIVEGLLDRGRQACILDPTGAWYGLRLLADGKSKGWPIILLGGEHGDIPLSARSGEAVARLVTEQRASVVIDTSGLTVGEYTRFFIDFAGKLYTSIRSPLHLVIDEAHYFAPQGKVPDPDTGRMLHAANRLMSGGRSRGVRAMLITQRPAKLHKDSLSCVDTLIAMRVMAPQDRGAIEDWIDGAADPKLGKQVLESLANMPRGEGWVWYPEGQFLERVTFPKIKTYDSSATPTGDGRPAPTIGEINLDAVRSALADAVKEAEANDPKALKRRIGELEQQVRQHSPDERSIKSAIESAIEQRDKQWHSSLSRHKSVAVNLAVKVAALSLELSELDKRTGEFATEFCRDVLNFTNAKGAQAVAAQPATKHHANGVAAKNVEAQTGQTVSGHSRDAITSPVAGNAGGTLGGGLRRMMIALAQRPQGLNRQQLGARAGLSSKSGTFDTYLSRARQAGWIRNAGERMVLTDLGLRELGDYEPLPTGEQLIAYWMGKVGGGAARILRACCDAYPHGLTREQLGNAAGLSHTSGTFDTYLSRLRALELIEGRGEIKASEELFN